MITPTRASLFSPSTTRKLNRNSLIGLSASSALPPIRRRRKSERERGGNGWMDGGRPIYSLTQNRTSLLHSNTEAVMKEQDGLRLQPTLSFLECIFTCGSRSTSCNFLGLNLWKFKKRSNQPKKNIRKLLWKGNWPWKSQWQGQIWPLRPFGGQNSLKEFAWKNPEFLWNSNLLTTSFKKPKQSWLSQKITPSKWPAAGRRYLRSGPCWLSLFNISATRDSLISKIYLGQNETPRLWTGHLAAPERERARYVMKSNVQSRQSRRT